VTPRPPHPTDAPLVICVTRGFDSYTFFLEPDSQHRLTEVLGAARPLPDRVSIALDLARPFAEAFGPRHGHLLPLLTNLEVERLRRLGGVDVRDDDSGQLLWRLRP